MNLEDYDVSEKYGFMLPDPLHKLPEYFQPWNFLAENLSNLIINKKLRNEVDVLPVLDHEKLLSHKEKRLAHLQLSLIASGYIWQDGDRGVPNVLPESIAVPWYRISEDLGILPIICHADVVLANWKLKDPERPPILENLRCLYFIPGGMDANWFFMVTARIELDFTPALKCIVDGIKAADDDNTETLIQSLRSIRRVILQVKETLSHMHELVSAEVFYDTIRPFLGGFGGEGSPLPDGLVYTGISDKPLKMAGGSAAQSSTLQCLDAALGIQHETDKQNFLNQMRDHMPRDHKRFIEAVREKSNIRNYVMQSNNEELIQIFNDVLSTIVNFRSYHITVVSKYVVTMSNRDSRNQDYESVAKKGTGGTNWTLTDNDLQKTCQEDNFDLLNANRLAIKRQEKEFMAEVEDLRQQFREMLMTAGVNQSQFPVTPNKNQSIPTLVLTPGGLTDLDIQKCLLINSLNDSACHMDRLQSDGYSDDSPMSTDTEDSEDETVFMEREVEGCEDNYNDSLQFSTSFVAGHVTDQRPSTSRKSQGSNPLANSTMIEEGPVELVLQKKSKPVSRCVSIPKASSTLLYKPSLKSQRSFSPVVKLSNLGDVQTQNAEKKETTMGNANSVFTWSLQHSSTDVPLEESYLRTVRKRQVSKVMRSSKMSVIEGKLGQNSKEVVQDSMCIDNPLYNQARSRSTIPTHSQVQKSASNEEIFKKPSALNCKESRDGIVRKNSVVKKLMRFKESFKRKNGTTDLRTLAVM